MKLRTLAELMPDQYRDHEQDTRADLFAELVKAFDDNATADEFYRIAFYHLDAMSDALQAELPEDDANRADLENDEERERGITP